MIPKLRLGLVCINESLRDDGRDWLMERKLIQKRPRAKVPIFCSRNMPRSTYSKTRALEKAAQNVQDIEYLLLWNEEHGINHLRLSSDLFPRYTDKEVESYSLHEDMPEVKLNLERIGAYANSHHHRITMHPDQFVLVGAREQHVFEASLDQLRYHSLILDTMQIDSGEGILCIHGGGTYGDKEAAIRRWIDQFDDLDRKIKDRLAIENCEKCYNLQDCLQIADACKIPVILDTHHYQCYNHYHPNETQPPLPDLLDEVVDSWSGRRPCFHISEQAENKAIGAHHDFVETIPECLLSLSETTPFDLEVEAKRKEAAVLYLMNKYKLTYCKF
jgi:UV DNA damage endonuclease